MRRLVERGGEPAIAEELVRAGPAGSLRYGEREIVEDSAMGCAVAWPRPCRRGRAKAGGLSRSWVRRRGQDHHHREDRGAAALLEIKLKVALVTVDSYRIGAGEQISRYGEIMGVPTHLARDQAGCAPRWPPCRGATGFSSIPRDDRIRGVGGTSQPAESERPKQSSTWSCRLRPAGATARPWSSRFKSRGGEPAHSHQAGRGRRSRQRPFGGDRVDLPDSCVTNGQRVPDDLHQATGPLLVELVLGQGE